MSERYTFEISGDDPSILGLVAAMRGVALTQMDERGLKSPESYVVLAIALARLVWESGEINDNIPPTVIQTLLNLAVDHGMAERIGMVQMRNPGETLQ
jgi:hypothetical protein